MYFEGEIAGKAATGRAPHPKDARRAAFDILNRLDRGRETLDQVLERYFEGTPVLPQRERAFLYAQVYGVLRWRGRLDWIIGYFSKTPLAKIDPKILNLLRLGLFQMTGLDKIPASAAVNTSVEIAKSFAPPWLVKFVNANLRKMAQQYAAVPFPDLAARTAAALAANQSFPQWLMQRWLKRFGFDETLALCEAVNRIPPITLRTHTLNCDRETLAGALIEDAEQIEPAGCAPDGIRLRHLKKPISAMKSFRRGWFQVQDEAAQLVSLLLNPRIGERILDACAGLGGKTGHIAQLMADRGEIVAMDVDGAKLRRLETEMKRLALTAVKTVPHDLAVPLQPERIGLFDRVLLDAPCSGLGAVRRNPDIKWFSALQNLKPAGARQVCFIDNISRLVRPGGLILYAVCSTEPEENEYVVRSFLKNHPNFAIDGGPGGLPAAGRALLDAKGNFRTFPHRNDMDGFYAVRLRRAV